MSFSCFIDGCSHISGHHCPLGFDLVSGKCVALTNRPMTYNEAQVKLRVCRNNFSQVNCFQFWDHFRHDHVTPSFSLLLVRASNRKPCVEHIKLIYAREKNIESTY